MSFFPARRTAEARRASFPARDTAMDTSGTGGVPLVRRTRYELRLNGCGHVPTGWSASCMVECANPFKGE